MAFKFAYMKNGGVSVVKDYALATDTNYKAGTGTNGATKGDAVYLASGLVIRSRDVATPVKMLGVLEGKEFLGLATGGDYEATNSSFNSAAVDTTLFPNGMGKVRIGNDVVYKVPVKSGQTAALANVGSSYGISQDATGDQTVDLTEVTNLLVKVEDYTPDGAYVFVSLLT